MAWTTNQEWSMQVETDMTSALNRGVQAIGDATRRRQLEERFKKIEDRLTVLENARTGDVKQSKVK